MARRSRRLNWDLLLCEKRLEAAHPASQNSNSPEWLVQSRTEIERDVDRILFSTPARRLGDKTQVFPLEKNVSVRNRLTHSHEVSNIARSMGTHIVYSGLGQRIIDDLGGGDDAIQRVRRDIPAILAAAGLAHDLGNPPFGHQGESAIRDWVRQHNKTLFSSENESLSGLSEDYRNSLLKDLENITNECKTDFTNFEGNAQTLRTVSRLQVVKDERGLNLSFATLASLMKYTVDSAHANKEDLPPRRKQGYFQSEAKLAKRIREETGLFADIRHPLTHLMEACDDICYLIVDAEDAVKKQIVSFHDLMAWLRSQADPSGLSAWVIETAEGGSKKAKEAGLSPTELNDVSMQIFRANAITALVAAVISEFEKQYETIMTKPLPESLLTSSRGSNLASSLREFDETYAYKNLSVLQKELTGFNAISELMTMLWSGIVERETFDAVSSKRKTPFARYAYGRISENYRRVFEGKLPDSSFTAKPLPIRYREIQLLTDMISGMTDQYAIDLRDELRAFRAGAGGPYHAK